jgi:hypothetical protein
VFSFVILTVDTIQTDGDAARWIVEHVGRGGILAFMLALYLLAGTIGTGLLRLVKWARVGMLCASGALLTGCVVFGIFGVARTHHLDTGVIVNAVVFGWPLYYFNRPQIRSLFT